MRCTGRAEEDEERDIHTGRNKVHVDRWGRTKCEVEQKKSSWNLSLTDRG